eukprot:NODE_10462_length_1350_cov_4.466067.p3 GENE.NODE_10462_length_1350_cov_4.466067~~NODE_10462_length_1350_cov_4.466067.p3  ORF type:complete len:132 (+),score=45.70 NODE_10462_length_1350_cov_4.466067:728-1123(+)
MISWACATLLERPVPVLRVAAARHTWLAPNFGALELTNIVWAFAHLAERDEARRAASAVTRCDASVTGGTDDALTSATPDVNPKNFYSLIWSAWRLMRRELAQELSDANIGRMEPIMHGVLLMDGQWSRGA